MKRYYAIQLKAVAPTALTTNTRILVDSGFLFRNFTSCYKKVATMSMYHIFFFVQPKKKWNFGILYVTLQSVKNQ